MCNLKLDRDDDDILVKLTRRNVEMVEAMIKENSSYALTLNDEEGVRPESKFLEYLKKFVKSADENALIDKKDAEAFCGSTKWWVEQLKECKDEETEYFKILIAGLIHNIDRTNSTHLNARTKNEETGETQGRKQIYKIITDEVETIKELKSMLEDENKPLIEIIAKKDYKTGKFNLSFATKFCHYLSWYLYENKNNKNNEDQNMYSIYDGVIAEALPLYIKSYELTDDIKNIKKISFPDNNQQIENFLKNPPFKKDNKGISDFYSVYTKIIDKIIEVGCEKDKEEKIITRRDFDHLVWYSNKGKTSTEDKESFDKYLEKFKKNLTKK